MRYPRGVHAFGISIHALHEESDQSSPTELQPKLISIHALHEESDFNDNTPRVTDTFQSTLSMRRATARSLLSGWNLKDISIHALHEESDYAQQSADWGFQFQSTLSMRRATVQLDIFVRFLRRKPAA